jgi:hypothetical protein
MGQDPGVAGENQIQFASNTSLVRNLKGKINQVGKTGRGQDWWEGRSYAPRGLARLQSAHRHLGKGREWILVLIPLIVMQMA